MTSSGSCCVVSPSRIPVERNFAAYQIDVTGTDGNGYIADWMVDKAGVLFRNNVAYRNMGAGFNVTESPNCVFLNNTMVENGYKAVNPRNGAGIKLSRENARGQTVVNNIFYNNAAAGIKGDGTIRCQKLIDHNLYFSASNAPFIWDAYQFDRAAYRTIEEIREQTTWEENGLAADPQFVSSKLENFRLKTDSPAVDAGRNVAEVADDFDGHPRAQGGKHDRGAFEFRSSD
jgi:parallel beta-helix repeat protein